MPLEGFRSGAELILAVIFSMLLLAGGFSMHYCMRVTECQSILWKEHRINRPMFLKLFAEFYENRPVPLPTEIHVVHVYGGTANDFTKRSWVCIHGKKYILFQIRLEEYRRMRARAAGVDAHASSQ